MTKKHRGGGDKRRVLTTQFRQEAVQLVMRDGKSLANWVSLATGGQLGAVDSR